MKMTAALATIMAANIQGFCALSQSRAAKAAKPIKAPIRPNMILTKISFMPVFPSQSVPLTF